MKIQRKKGSGNSPSADGVDTPRVKATIHPNLITAALVIFGLIVATCIYEPSGIKTQTWHRIVLLLTCVIGMALQPYPLPVLVILSLAIGLLTGTITLEHAFKGYSSEVVWIVVLSLICGQAITKTGIGNRLAQSLISKIGRSPLGLAYSLAATDFIIAPVTSSSTARSGVILPIAESVAKACGPAASKLGSYLLFSVFQANVITSAMFLTAMVLNPLAIGLARDQAGVSITWTTWFIAASVPGLICLILVPYLIYKVYPPDSKTDLTGANVQALDSGRGGLRREEKQTVFIFVLLLGFWVTSGYHGISPVAGLLAAVFAFIACGILNVDEALSDKNAWSTFLWIGGVLSIAGSIDKSPISDAMGQIVRTLGFMDGLTALCCLSVIYFFLHYFFASMTVHMVLFFPIFLTVAIEKGAPAILAALVLSFVSSLYSSLTYYGSPSAAMYYSSGYIDRSSWLRVGLLVGIIDLLIWLGVGIPWCRLVGIGR